MPCAPAFTLSFAPPARRRRPATCAASGGATSAKGRLLRILPSFINLETQSSKVGELIQELERDASPPATPEFTSMFLEGDWRLLFSSARPTKVSGDIRVRRIVQSIRTVPDRTLINTVDWSWARRGGEKSVDAVLRVVCSYEFAGATRINVALEDHQVRIPPQTAGPIQPEELQDLVMDLQRSLPIELFDPSGLQDISVIQPDFRIARFLGKRIAGVRNIFVSDSVPHTVPADRD